MSDPERHGPAAEIAPQLRGKRFRKYMGRLVADMAGRRGFEEAAERGAGAGDGDLPSPWHRQQFAKRLKPRVRDHPRERESPLRGQLRRSMALCEGDAFRSVALHGPLRLICSSYSRE